MCIHLGFHIICSDVLDRLFDDLEITKESNYVIAGLYVEPN